MPAVAQERLVKPKLIVSLGATALRAVAGKTLSVLQNRGRTFASIFDVPMFVTVHPSSLLRAPDPEARKQAFDVFVQDLRKIGRLMAEVLRAA
jgi:DNA polymerase